MNPRLLLLTLCQGLLMVNNVVFIAVNGLVGLALAPVGWMATLPITAYVAGGALATGLVARHSGAGAASAPSRSGFWWPSPAPGSAPGRCCLAISGC